MELKPGSRLASVVCATEVVVVRPPGAPVDLRCGGQPMVPAPAPGREAAPAPDHADGTPVGKRYADPDSGLEVLCVVGGDGSLSLSSAPLLQKDAKPLPSSD